MTSSENDPQFRSDLDRPFVPLRDASLILGLQLLLLVFRLGYVPLLGPDEPRYARVAVEMARTNAFVTPTLAGEAWLEKPPLYYWLAGFGFRVFGENEWAARWPAVMAALLLTGATGLFGARLFGSSAGRLAMLIAATSPLTFAYGRVATMDMLVAGFATAATGLLLLRLLNIAGRLAIPAAWALMAVAFLAKGPIGFLIPLAIAVLWLALTSRLTFQATLSLFPPAGVLAGLIVAGPWVAAICVDQGWKFVEVFLLNHNLQRFTSTIHNHPGPFYYYVPVLLLGVFPWSGLAALAAPVWSSVAGPRRSALVAWALAPLILFSLAGSKLPGYILPCVPPFAILLALGASRTLLKPSVALRVAGLFGLIGAAVLAALTARGVRAQEPWARSAVMPAIWLVATMFLASRAFQSARNEVIRILSIGAAGFLLILTLVAPPVLEAMESGRRLFLPAEGRDVLVLGAWRTAWMAGYFYNDGRVKEVSTREALLMIKAAPQLLLMGESESREFGRSSELSVLQLAEGPRGNVLARVTMRAGR